MRSARDRYNLLERKYKKKKRQEIDYSGTLKGSELDGALEDAIASFDSHEMARQKEKAAVKIMTQFKQKTQD